MVVVIIMDWFNWLSQTSLDSTLVYEYGVAFENNELEEEDIAYFNHEFLQSMGISIAKHRLEILKLARKVSHKKHPISKLVLVFKKTKKSLANYIATLVHPRVNEDNRALVLVPNNNKNNTKNSKNSNIGGGALSYSTRWKRAMMLKNNRKYINNNHNYNNYKTNNNNNNNIKNDISNKESLMITNGDDYLGDYLGDDQIVVSTPKLDSYSSPLMYDLQQSNNKEEKVIDDHNHDDHDVDDDDVVDQYWSPTLEEIRWDAMFQDLKPT